MSSLGGQKKLICWVSHLKLSKERSPVNSNVQIILAPDASMKG